MASCRALCRSRFTYTIPGFSSNPLQNRRLLNPQLLYTIIIYAVHVEQFQYDGKPDYSLLSVLLVLLFIQSLLPRPVRWCFGGISRVYVHFPTATRYDEYYYIGALAVRVNSLPISRTARMLMSNQ